MPGTGGLAQRVLWLAEPQTIGAEPAKPGIEAAAGGTARKVSRHGGGQPQTVSKGISLGCPQTPIFAHAKKYPALLPEPRPHGLKKATLMPERSSNSLTLQYLERVSY